MPNPPNIVVMMTDQHRADVSAREGFGLDTTPFLDTLAESGTWFDRAYTTTPVCAPARVSFLTGRWPSATGVDTNSVNTPRYERDLFDITSESGYTTALIGKNHSHLSPERVDYWSEYGHGGGTGPDRSPEEQAMDEWLSDLNHGVASEPAPHPVDATPPARIVEEACEWIQSIDNPFCLWMSIPEPHNPFYAPEPYFSMFPPSDLPPLTASADDLQTKGSRWQFLRNLEKSVVGDFDMTIPRYRSNYFGMLRLIDDQIKQFVSFLDDAGLRDNTVIIYLSDHGDFVGEYGLMRKGDRTAEILARIPLIIDGPGVTSTDGPHSAHVSIADVTPTLCEIIGEPLPPGVQGRSLWPVLADEPYPEAEFQSVYVEGGYGGLPVSPEETDQGAWLPDSIGFHELNPVMQSGRAGALRMGDWRLHVDAVDGIELYNIATDPLELDDRSEDSTCEDVLQDLLVEMTQWQLRLTDSFDTESPADPKRHPRNYWSRMDR